MAAPGPSPLRTAAEAALCEVTGATRIVRLCPSCGSAAHGAPRAVGSELTVSISYARTPHGDALAVVAWGPGLVGVDVEAVDSSHDDLPAWTRTEALAKAAGTGLRDWPDMALPDLPTRPLELPAGYAGTLAGRDAGWRVVRG